MAEITVRDPNYLPDFLFFPAYPFEGGKEYPFMVADYLASPSVFIPAAMVQVFATLIVFKMVGLR